MQLIGYDCETYLISKGRLIPRLVCLTLAGDGDPPRYLVDVAKPYNDKGRWSVLLSAADALPVWRLLIADPNVVLVAQNAVFDPAVLAEHGGRPGDVADVFTALAAGRVRDTMIREKLLAVALDRLSFDPRTGRPSGFSLAALVEAYFGVDLSADKKGPDAWRLRYAELDGVPVSQWPAAARDYAIDDAVWVLDVHRVQGEPMQADNDQPIAVGPGEMVPIKGVGKDHAGPFGAIVDEDNQLRAAWALHLMAAWGLRTDVPRVEAWGKVLEAAVQEGDAIAKAAGFLRPNGSKNMKELQALVSTAYDGSPELTPGGKPKTSREVLEGSGNPALVTYAASGVDRKNLSTYLPILRGAGTHAMTSSPNVLVASGRTSWRHPNMQNPPRKGPFRECFVPRPGMVFVSCDYSGAELVALAQVLLWSFGSSSMADAIRAGRDLHVELAAAMLGITYEEALARHLADKLPERQEAKAGNFGFPGGLGAEAFAGYCSGMGIDLSMGGQLDAVERAEEIRDAWFDRWPEMKDYFKRIGELSRWGRFTASQFISKRQRGGCSFTSGANTYFQGLVADGAKRACWDLSRLCHAPDPGVFGGVHPVLFIHDEIIAEGPEDTVHLWGDAMAKVMVDAMQPYVPDLPVVAEPAAMRRWHKGAKTTRDAAGRLCVWEPST